MNDVQVWSIIGVLAATIVSMMVGMFTLFGRTLTAQFAAVNARIDGMSQTFEARIDALDTKVDARFDAVNVRFESIDRRFESIDRRFESMERRIENMDGDIQQIANKVFGQDDHPL